MRIKMLRSIKHTDGKDYVGAEEYDVSDAIADQLIKQGSAIDIPAAVEDEHEEVEEDDPETGTKRKVKRAKAKKK